MKTKMDQYIEWKQRIQTQDEKRSEEFSVSIPSKIFKTQKEADVFVKAFYWSPVYVMKEFEWKRIEVKPYTYIRFIEEKDGRYRYSVIQERILPKKDK